MQLLDLTVTCCRLFFASIIAAAIVCFLVPQFRAQLVLHGKLKAPKQSEDKDPLLIRLMRPLKVLDPVPKNRFSHFYIFGACWNACVIVSFCISNGSQFTNDTVAKLILLGCFELHLLRRSYESVYIDKHSAAATMLFGHYVLGIMFYFFTSLSLALDWSAELVSDDGTLDFLFLPVSMFLYSSVNQNTVHRILSGMKADSPDKYQIPRDAMFDDATCPHYGFEMMIYISLFTLSRARNTSLNLCVVWVIVNLTILAYETKKWYLDKFKDDREFLQKRYLVLSGIF